MFWRAQRALECGGVPPLFHFSSRVRLLVRILGTNSQRDSAACGELRGDDGFARRARFDEVVKNAIRDCFVERALVSIRGQIKFQRLAFDAETVGHVIDIDPGEVGLACYRTNRCEIIGFKMDPIIAAGGWIWECLKTCLGWRSGDSCFASSEQSQLT